MRKLFIALSLLIITTGNLNAQNGWLSQTSGTSLNLHSVHFASPHSGWACGDSGLVLNTTDGGGTWHRQNSGTLLPLTSIMFADSIFGWVIGGDPISTPLCDHYFVVLRTTNGGMNWINQINPPNYLFNDLYVVNRQTAFITNEGVCCPPFCTHSAGAVYKTTNGGMNWSGSYSRASFSVFFLDSINGWASSVSASDIPPAFSYFSKTTNAGSTWQDIRVDTAYYESRHLQFLNLSTGYVQRQGLKKTTDGGFTWFQPNGAATQNYSNHFFVNASTGWCVGNAGIIRTNDGGANWTPQTSVAMTAVHFFNEQTGWAVGRSGRIFKTITGGTVSAGVATETANSFELFQNYPNPFNPATSIQFSVSHKSEVRLIVYDMNGKEVSTLVSARLQAGMYNTRFDAGDLPSGVYFYKLRTETTSAVRRMVLIR